MQNKKLERKPEIPGFQEKKSTCIILNFYLKNRVMIEVACPNLSSLFPSELVTRDTSWHLCSHPNSALFFSVTTQTCNAWFYGMFPFFQFEDINSWLIHRLMIHFQAWHTIIVCDYSLGGEMSSSKIMTNTFGFFFEAL